MKTFIFAFVAAALTIGAGAAQAGTNDRCLGHDLSVHGVWDCR
jgi:hypothetical protein